MQFFNKEEINNILQSVTEHDILAALRQKKFHPHNFLSLLSPLAEKYLPQILNESDRLTRQRFGNIMQLYIPVYLSNECQNICTYCGFSFTNRIPRKTLSLKEMEQEAEYLKKRGFEHVLLVTGEAQKTVGLEYFMKALEIFIPRFSSVAMEVQPLETEEYLQLHKAGVYSILVYQETYDREVYARVHPKGKKSNFDFRLNAPYRICQAGMHHCGLGALLGLSDWRYDSLHCAMHLNDLQNKFWQSRFSVSFPRIRPAEGAKLFPIPFTIKNFVQLIAAYRICFPDVELSLSTREKPEFRDRILRYGFTQISAESKTSPGGYTLEKNLEQFTTDDIRSLEEIKKSIRTSGLEPVMKNWIGTMVN